MCRQKAKTDKDAKVGRKLLWADTKMQMENNWKVMREENGKQHNGQNMLKEPGQFPAQDIPNDDEQLTMRDLTVGYDRIPLIKNINLGVRPGEILTLIGPNGSGKSTILKTITKQLKTIGGSVFLGKESMRELTDSEISRHLSMVMTERIHTELLSGRDVVATGRYPYTGRLGILSQQDWKKVDEAIALVHAGEVQQQDFRRISDGQRQRLMLARAICQDTQVLILDEPTSYLYGVKPQQFEPQTGQVFMERPEGIPEVFVIGGGGTGLAVYNRLQRQNIPFAAGILQENDVEYAAASALAACVFSEKAFFPVSEETFLRAKQMLDDCDACICALTEFGPYNEKNRQLYEYAKKLGKVCAEI